MIGWISTAILVVLILGMAQQDTSPRVVFRAGWGKVTDWYRAWMSRK